jgi:hypothetical protein
VEQSRLRVLEPAFFANGAEVGGVRERALGSPTHPLAHRGAWRRRAGRGSSAPPLLAAVEVKAEVMFFGLYCLYGFINSNTSTELLVSYFVESTRDIAETTTGPARHNIYFFDSCWAI